MLHKQMKEISTVHNNYYLLSLSAALESHGVVYAVDADRGDSGGLTTLSSIRSGLSGVANPDPAPSDCLLAAGPGAPASPSAPK